MNQHIENSESAMPAEESVLVIDDDDLTQALVSEMLRLNGVQVIHTAEDGHVALKVLASLPSPPKYLLCDIMMPNMNGIELLDKLAAQKYPGKIVLMTGSDPAMLSISRTIALSHGLRVVNTLFKPVSMEQLTSVLRN